MIQNLKQRKEFWGKRKNRGPIDGSHDISGSMPYPFEAHVELFKSKDVLELGPGNGRQYDVLKDVVKRYSVCDISSEALGEGCFVNLSKHLLYDYKQDLLETFEIIHFWYVLHHVTFSELDLFFGFVYRHLKVGGCVLFNTPQIQVDTKIYPGDGIGTTNFNLMLILKTLEVFNFRILNVEYINKESTGYLIIALKEGL